jgi:hypothetical protein
MNQDSSFSERSILLFILENCIPLPPLCQAVKVVCYLNLKSGHYKAQKWTAEFFNIQGFKVEKLKSGLLNSLTFKDLKLKSGQL